VSVGLPIFPLGAVLYPGITMPLHIFEDRYRSLISTLLSESASQDRAFGIVAIREGFEVGARGVHSVHRVGCEARLQSVDALDDGGYDIEVVGGRRLRIDALDPSGEYIVAEVEWLEDADGDDAEAVATQADATFDRYREALATLRGNEVLTGELPQQPGELSYALAASCLLTLEQRQHLLEVDDAATRLRGLITLMRQEMRAMRAIPSLPATEVARTGWSPN
jgi:uncharacterized protein